MNATKAQLRIQYNRAKKLGWLPFFEEAAAEITAGKFDTADLLGIASRETNLDPKWLTKAGDGGNGFGLMQADRRSFPEFTKGDGWKDARTGILFGAKVLMQKWDDFQDSVGKRRTVHSSKGGSYTFTAKSAVGQIAQHIVISSYNCGLWAQYAWAHGMTIDKYSTGHDYGQDVMERAAVFRELLAAEAKVSAADSAPEKDAQISAGSEQPVPGNPLPEQPPISQPVQAAAAPETFSAHLPQIDTAKDWIQKALAGTSIGTALSVAAGWPLWLQIGLFSLLALIVVGAIVIFAKYHKEIFVYVTQMNTLRATPGVGSPLISGPPPR